MLGAASSGGLWPPLTISDLANVHWPTLAGQAGNLAAFLVISAVALSLNTAGIGIAAQAEIDLDREMRAARIANITAGAGGGLPGYQALSLSVLGSKIGTNSRLIGFCSALLAGLAWLLGATLLAYVPKMIVGGLLFFLGVELLVE